MNEAERRAAWESFIMTREYRQSVRDNGNEWNEEEERARLEFVFDIAPDIAKAEKAKRLKVVRDEYHKAHTTEGVLITISIDQKQSISEAIASQNAVIEDLRKAKYSWMIDGRCSYEYWSDGDSVNAENLKYNPHIHLIVRKSGKLSVIRQHLARKFKNKKYGVYIFDVKPLAYNLGEEYVQGKKVEDKQFACLQDAETRDAYSVSHIIII